MLIRIPAMVGCLLIAAAVACNRSAEDTDSMGWTGTAGPEATLRPSTPIPTASPLPSLTPVPDGSTVRARLSEPLLLRESEVAELEGTGLTIELLEAEGPRPGCFDCPSKALLRVTTDGNSQELRYHVGFMPPEVQQRARTETAFGFTFFIVKINEDSVVIRVNPDSP